MTNDQASELESKIQILIDRSLAKQKAELALDEAQAKLAQFMWQLKNPPKGSQKDV